MLCSVINGPTYTLADEQINCFGTDLVELRLDLFDEINFSKIKELRSKHQMPMIFTLRPTSQMGGFQGNIEERLEVLLQLAALKPEFLDLEYDTPKEFIKEIGEKFPNIKLIISYHNFEKTSDYDEILKHMQKIPATYYKIAVMSQNIVDTLSFIVWAKRNNTKKTVIAISMGKHGQISRILSRAIGNPFTYVSDIDENMIGILSKDILHNEYRGFEITAKTKLFCLIGSPVEQSTSHIYHNSFFREQRIDAVYFKMDVKPDELKEVIYLAKNLGIDGMSVTMPLKEHVMKYIDVIDIQANDIGAVNTILFKDGKSFGFNTDGKGALDALERHGKVKDKQVVIIGAGGAAKAIAFEAHKRGAKLTILNRDVNKAKKLAERFQVSFGGLSDMKICAKDGYDVLINCTPEPMPIRGENLLHEKIVMDIRTSTLDSGLLGHAKKADCTTIHGKEMFQEQAKGQYAIWGIKG